MTAYIPTLPYTAVLDRSVNENLSPLKQWCWQNIGLRYSVVEDNDSGRNGLWTVIWTGFKNGHHGYGYCWYFKREQDMMLFRLKWA